MNPGHHFDSNIPILTEVISVDDVSSSLEDSQAQTKARDVETNQLMMSEQALDQLEKTLRENVLRQLLTRIDFVLEHRVRDGLADVLQIAVDGLAKEIRQGLSKSLEEVIHRTVSQEISKIQSSNTKN